MNEFIKYTVAIGAFLFIGLIALYQAILSNKDLTKKKEKNKDEKVITENLDLHRRTIFKI